MKKIRIIAALLVVGLLAAACGDSSSDTTVAAVPAAEDQPVEQATDEMADIVDTAVGAGTFTTLVTAVEAAGLVDTLKGEGPFTVFAPTDEAFAALPEGTLDSLLADTTALAGVLTYHVVPGKVLAEDVVGLSSATSVQGSDIAIRVEGDSVFVNDAAVVATDIQASNGVIHVIDSVILPPAETEAMADIVDTAIAAGSFNTLVTAVEAAGLVDTLKGEGPFTVFAPTDEAFALLPEGVLESLLEDTAALTDVLTYHVVPGKVLAEDVVGLNSATTVQGSDVAITIDGDSVLIDEAMVITTDIETSNGVIHVIDAVITP